MQAHRDAAGALVQDGKLGLVVEEAGHAQALLLPQAQHLTPVHLQGANRSFQR